jgi:CRP-like cAMP-binding protein
MYAPGDIVLEEGELTSTLYFITSGSVDIYHIHTNSSFRELTSDAYFGEIAFFT